MPTMDRFVNSANLIFDPLNRFWEKKSTHQWASGILILLFLSALGAIELNRQGILPGYLADKIPYNHYLAINIAFTLVLILEVVSLIFTLPCSLSRALGKQFEILALIFLRSSFKELAVLPEPISVTGHMDVLWRILADGAGAIAIFALLGVYTKLLRKLDDTLKPGIALARFVAAKKMVAVTILIIFLGMGMVNSWLLLTGQAVFHFFQHFYTVLIFSDVMLVLVAQFFLPEFRAVFRNAGYAMATLLIRLALTAPAYYNVLIGISSVLFAVLLTLIYNTFYTSQPLQSRE